jgi:WD40 repeat protein
MDSYCILNSPKDPDIVDFHSKKNHKGTVTCLLYTQLNDLDVLISGSADRTIKLWETKNLGKQEPCF